MDSLRAFIEDARQAIAPQEPYVAGKVVAEPSELFWVVAELTAVAAFLAAWRWL